ncbi:MAG TPA: hypothetical protein VF181_04605 [Balneolaceae bacterium]
MKTLLKHTFFLVGIILAFSFQPANAQQSVDMERMNRDINIMENILQELFKTKVESHFGGIVSFGDDGIRGAYIPEYGVIFSVPHQSNNYIFFSGDEGESSSFTFQYNSESDGDTITAESVIDRISEFLRDYASTIGQLSANGRVTVIYSTEPSRRQVFTFVTDDGQGSTHKTESLPTISVTAQMGDLQAYRSGDISQEEFNQRLQINKTEADDEGPVDLKVMATIFETAFEGGDEKLFRVSGSVDYLHLDNFGALFSLEAEYTDDDRIFGVSIGSINQRIKVIGDRLEGTEVETDSANILESITIDSDDALEEYEEEAAEHKAEVLEAYKQFKQRLKEYLVDYGRTLSSVGSNQHILVSVNIQSSVDEIPGRVDFQLEKSILEQMDEGDISREEAMSEIRVREY